MTTKAKIIIGSVTTAVLFSACGQMPPLVTTTTSQVDVGVQKLVIDDLSRDEKVSASDVIYVNGWAPIHQNLKPTINVAMVSKIRSGMRAVGRDQRADVSILRAGLFEDKNVADDVVVVGMLTSWRDRKFKCDIDANIKVGDVSKRVVVEHIERRRPFETNDEAVKFISECQDKAMKQLGNEIDKAAKL